MPFPRTRVVPGRWSEHHRPTATSTMTGECTITRAGVGPGAFNPTTLKTEPAARITVAARVPCKVQAQATAERIVPAGDAVKTLRTYQVSLEHDVPEIRIGDRLAIDTAEDDELIGRTLTVRDVAYGTEQWQRDLICQDDLG